MITTLDAARSERGLIPVIRCFLCGEWVLIPNPPVHLYCMSRNFFRVMKELSGVK